MNAKMTITIPVDDIPRRISELLMQVSNDFYQISNEVHSIHLDLKQKIDFSIILKNVNEVREKLTLLDANLDDSYSVLEGYMKFKYGTQQKQLKEEQNEPSESR